MVVVTNLPFDSKFNVGGQDAKVIKELVTRAISFPLGVTRPPVCDTPIDIMLVIDGSGSISSADFSIIRRYRAFAP